MRGAVTDWQTISQSWVVLILVPLIVTVIGSALWEYGLRSLFRRLGSSILNGIGHSGSRILNGLVRDAARRTNPTNGIVCLFIASLTSLGVGWSAMGAVGEFLKPAGAGITEAGSMLAKLPSLPPNQQLAELLRARAILDTIDSENGRGLQYACFVFCIGFWLLFILCLRAAVVTALIDAFAWRLKCVRPSVTDGTLHEIERDWARMDNMRDLGQIMQRLDRLDKESRKQPK